jgi:dihydroxyacetone kinase-like protein
MEYGMDASAIKQSLRRWTAGMKACAAELNELDGRLGDGDLGATLEKCATNVDAALATAPDAIDGIFKACAQACAKASGSSFGTLLAQAFLVAAKRTASRTMIDRSDLAPLLDEVVAALSTRGGAKLGDKTMLDSLNAIARAFEISPVSSDDRSIAIEAARAALEEFRQRPNKIGRARMFEAKSTGLDDPGMVAILRMTQCI